jgi:mannose-6-phosphate isomerase
MHAPLVFEPVFMERVWGGRRLEQLFDKPLPDGAVIGESWELVDRPGEAESVVAAGEYTGRTIGELWRSKQREDVFGSTAAGRDDRFPLLIKLLDCEQSLSVQVHPPASVAAELGGEPKTEMWVIVDAAPGAHLLTGLRKGVTREQFEAALTAGDDVSEMLFRHDVHAGDVMYLPAGRVHAICAGTVIIEIQQNSDTTYRVFDYNRPGLDGKPRQLHIPESLASIDWDDFEPPLVASDGEALVHNEIFEVDRLTVSDPRVVASPASCAVVVAIDAAVSCGDSDLERGQLFLVPAGEAASLPLSPTETDEVTVLRTMLPGGR